MGNFRPENGTSSKLLIDSKNFFQILQNKRANRYMKILLLVFQEKKSFGQFDLSSRYVIFYCLIGHDEIEPGHC